MSKGKVLVVDDNPVNIEIIQGFLENEEYEVISAMNGEDGLKKIYDEKPDVVILDVVMPIMDGFEVCKRVKENKKTYYLPIVIVTALSEKKHRIKGIESGADDFLTKPIDKIELITRVKSLIKTKRIYQQLQDSYNNLNYQLELANKVQRGILIKELPELETIEINKIYKPAEKIGGDFYEVVDFGDDKLGVFIADSMGHGVPAALVMAMVKIAFTQIKGKDSSPQKLMEEMNTRLLEIFQDDLSGLYITAFYMIIDKKEKKVIYSNGGHPNPIVLREDGDIINLDAEGAAPGLIEDEEYITKDLSLNKGDIMLIYTDGIFDIFDNEMLGAKKIIKDEGLNGLINYIKNVTDAEHFKDDITLLTLDFS